MTEDRDDDERGARVARLLPRLDGGPGPARRMSDVELAAWVQAAVSASATPIPARRTAVGRWRPAAAAALAFALGGLALAAVAVRSHRNAPGRTSIPGPAPGRARSTAAPAQPATPLPPEEPAPAAPAPVPHPALAVRAPGGTLDDLLRRANQRRAQRRWLEAETLYARAAQQAPGRDAAASAAVAAAALRLEHLGDPAGALRLYEGALRRHPDAVLAEEAAWGVAAAERALGHTAREAAALRAFVDRWPDSLARPRALARLRALRETPP